MLGTNAGAGDAGAGKTLSVTDPPWHDRLRRAMSRGLTPRVVQRLEHTMQGAAKKLVAEALERGTCDFVGDVAAKFPNFIICDLLGVPERDWERMYQLTSAAVGFDDPDLRLHTSAQFARLEAHSEIMLYYAEMISDRRRNPGPDLVSTLATASVDGRRLTDEEILANCDNFIIGGNETTRSAITGGMLMLMQHPGQWRKLREDPARAPGAVEEILRWTTPIMHSLRTATADVDIQGARISPGDTVVIWNASANRDETVFESPNKFDISRNPNKHLTFGMGVHHCIGSALARLEISVLFKELGDAIISAELAGDVERTRSNVLRGIKRMPVTLRPA